MPVPYWLNRKPFNRRAHGERRGNLDNVCLVVKDVGAESFYRYETSEALVKKLKSDPSAPEILYLKGDLSQSDLARLYSACDALVHPYRAEGFALPVLEAIACGKPVIVTAGGSTDDFVSHSAGWKIPARVKYFESDRVGSDPTVSLPWWLEPDASELSKLIKEIASEKQVLWKQGTSRRSALGWTWGRSSSVVENRVRELRARIPVRFQKSNG
jgi:glycosyltransferase involved in cell wall biosynthesis